MTPHLLVAADADGVDVPRQFVTEDGKITVNISPGAVRGLSLENELISFSARFSGQSYNVSLPPGAVLVAATAGGANAMGMARDIGTVAAGKVADFVVVSADPLADIANMRRIDSVVRAGVVHPLSSLERDNIRR